MADVAFYPTWKDIVVYAAGGPQPKTLAEMGNLRALVAGLEAGGKIPVHPEAVGLYVFLEGTGWMIVEGQRYPVAPGTIIVVPDGGRRGMEATTRLAFVAARVT